MVGRLQYLRFCLFEMYVNVVFGIRYLYSAVSLTLVEERRFIKKIFIIILIVRKLFSQKTQQILRRNKA